MRNSQQYWKALNLIPKDSHGLIRLTDYGRRVARHEISQTEFSAITMMTLRLPNPNIQNEAICEKWKNSGIVLYPLKLIMAICRETGYLTSRELRSVVIPLSGNPATTVQDYANFIQWYRTG